MFQVSSGWLRGEGRGDELQLVETGEGCMMGGEAKGIMDDYQALPEGDRSPRSERCSPGIYLAVSGFVLIVAIFCAMGFYIRQMSLSMSLMTTLLRDIETNTHSMCHALHTIDSNYTCA